MFIANLNSHPLTDNDVDHGGKIYQDDQNTITKCYDTPIILNKLFMDL